jgi:polysaccharide deacetylase 2 family uncharacterized protein YibQ
MNFFRSFRRFPFLSVVITAALIAAVVIFLERVDHRTDQTVVPDSRTAQPSEKAWEPEMQKRERPGADGGGRRIAVLIDDIGYDLRVVEELTRIGAPLAFAVLPHTPHAREAARLLYAAGREVLLHLPMEPYSYPEENPGPGALFVDMNDAAIVRQIEKDLAAVPHVSGVNNHMGSRFMEDETGLAVIMRELAKRDLFFVDSLTTAHSRARSAAAGAGVRFAARAVFIDHTPGYAAALASLINPPRQGWEQGEPLLMIGHPHPATIRALRDAQPLWQAEGVQMIPVSACLGSADGKEKRMRAQNSGMGNMATGRKP